MNARALLILATLALPLVGPAALARDDQPGAERAALDLDLRTRRVRLTGLDAATVSYLDESGQPRRAPVATLVALLPKDSTPPPKPRPAATPPAPGLDGRSFTGLLTLTDGQRFPGQRAGVDAQGEAIVWRHPRFGRITIPIDSVAAVVLDERALAAAGPSGDILREPVTKDTLLLTNGDTVTGFLSSLDEPLEVETDAGPVFVPTDRIVALRTANPPTRLKGRVVWLDDESVVSVDSIEPEGEGAVAIRLAESQTARYSIEAIEAVAFDASRIVPLASIAPRSQTPVGERSAFATVSIASGDELGAGASPLGADDIELPGPMTVVWPLPPGARRFAATAVLPPAARPWGDCVLVVRVDGVESLRERLSEARGSIDLAIPASGRELTVTIEPGEFGPINDRVTLQRAILLVEPPAS